MSPSEFATSQGFTDCAGREAFRRCALGERWNGIALPVERISGQRGGQRGEAWGLRLDLCPPEVLASLGLPETLPSKPVEQRLHTRSDDRHVTTALDKQRVIGPILETKRGSTERAQAFRNVAAQPAHLIGEKWQPVAEWTLRDWVNAAEINVAKLLPAARKDRGKHRVQITRRWQNGCGLPEEVQVRIAKTLEARARGLFLKACSERKVRNLCSNELQRLTQRPGYLCGRRSWPSCANSTPNGLGASAR